MEDDLPNRIVTSREGRYELSSESEEDNLLSTFFGKIDFLFIVSYVLSLVAFIFTFSTVSGEKESGTLRLVMSNQVPRWKIIFAKIIGNYAVFFAPLLIAQLVLLLILFSSSAIVMSSVLIIKTMVIFSSVFVFLLAMFTLGILVSILTGRSTTSIMSLLFIWVFLVLVIPKTSPMVAEILHPAKSRDALNREISVSNENLTDELNEKREELMREVGNEYGFDFNFSTVFGGQGDIEKRDQALARYDELKVPLEQEYEDKISSEIRKLETDYHNNLNAQILIARNFARFSPVSCFMFFIAELSGTGIGEGENIRENAVIFQDQIDREIYELFISKFYATPDGSRMQIADKNGDFDEKDLDVPQFRDYRRPSLGEILMTEQFDIGLLLFYAVLFFVLSYVSFIRYDVR